MQSTGSRNMPILIACGKVITAPQTIARGKVIFFSRASIGGDNGFWSREILTFVKYEGSHAMYTARYRVKT